MFSGAETTSIADKMGWFTARYNLGIPALRPVFAQGGGYTHHWGIGMTYSPDYPHRYGFDIEYVRETGSVSEVSDPDAGSSADVVRQGFEVTISEEDSFGENGFRLGDNEDYSLRFGSYSSRSLGFRWVQNNVSGFDDDPEFETDDRLTDFSNRTGLQLGFDFNRFEFGFRVGFGTSLSYSDDTDIDTAMNISLDFAFYITYSERQSPDFDFEEEYPLSTTSIIYHVLSTFHGVVQGILTDGPYNEATDTVSDSEITDSTGMGVSSIEIPPYTAINTLFAGIGLSRSQNLFWRARGATRIIIPILQACSGLALIITPVAREFDNTSGFASGGAYLLGTIDMIVDLFTDGSTPPSRERHPISSARNLQTSLLIAHAIRFGLFILGASLIGSDEEPTSDAGNVIAPGSLTPSIGRSLAVNPPSRRTHRETVGGWHPIGFYIDGNGYGAVGGLEIYTRFGYPFRFFMLRTSLHSPFLQPGNWPVLFGGSAAGETPPPDIDEELNDPDNPYNNYDDPLSHDGDSEHLDLTLPSTISNSLNAIGSIFLGDSSVELYGYAGLAMVYQNSYIGNRAGVGVDIGGGIMIGSDSGWGFDIGLRLQGGVLSGVHDPNNMIGGSDVTGYFSILPSIGVRFP